MSESFKITFNRSRYTGQSLVSILDINAPEANSLKSLGVVYIAYCEMNDSWLLERNGASEPKHIGLFFAVDGEFIIESVLGKITVKAGEAAVIPSWQDRRLSIENGQSKHLYIRIDDVKKYPHIDKIEVRKSFYANELVWYARHVALAQDPFSDSAEYRFHLFSMIQLLLRREIFSNESEAFCKLDRLFRLLGTNSGSKCSVTFFAQKLGISVSSFYKICMQYYGKSPSRIIAEANMRKATDLLRCTDLSLENISDNLGYANQFAFSKAFKKFMDKSPLQYRKQTK